MEESKLKLTGNTSGTGDKKRYECVCICGKVVWLSRKQLKRKITCGCEIKTKDKNPIPEGTRFGKLVVTGKTKTLERPSGKYLGYECVCDCGNIVYIPKQSLVQGCTTSCGCLAKEDNHYQPKFSGGEKYNSLTVTGEYRLQSTGPQREIYYRCICDCGGEVWATHSRIISGALKTCGCSHKKHMQEIQKEGIEKQKKLRKQERDFSILIPSIDPTYTEDIEGIENRGLTTHDKVHIVCQKCGKTHSMIIGNLVRASGDIILRNLLCLSCAKRHSSVEDELYSFVRELYEGNILCNQKILKKKGENKITAYEIDLYIPEFHLGIEYNGSYWHSLENLNNRNTHLDKYDLAKQNGIILIQVFEWQWDNTEYREKLREYIKGILRGELPKFPLNGKPKTIKVSNNLPYDSFLLYLGYSFLKYNPPKLHIHNTYSVPDSGYSIFVLG